GRYKAFLCVGAAYFLTAVLAPFAVLVLKGASWSFTPGGVAWSVLAGIVGAPVLNALYSLAFYPPAGGWRKLPWPFVLGLLLAALGGCLVTLYKPAPAHSPPPHRPVITTTAARLEHGAA